VQERILDHGLYCLAVAVLQSWRSQAVRQVKVRSRWEGMAYGLWEAAEKLKEARKHPDGGTLAQRMLKRRKLFRSGSAPRHRLSTVRQLRSHGMSTVRQLQSQHLGQDLTRDQKYGQEEEEEVWGGRVVNQEGEEEVWNQGRDNMWAIEEEEEVMSRSRSRGYRSSEERTHDPMADGGSGEAEDDEESSGGWPGSSQAVQQRSEMPPGSGIVWELPGAETLAVLVLRAWRAWARMRFVNRQVLSEMGRDGMGRFLEDSLSFHMSSYFDVEKFS
jgi:hypothetical protein